MELPPDFIHEPPENYTYEVESFRRNVLRIWCCNHSEFTYNGGAPAKTFGDSTMSNSVPTSPPSIVRNHWRTSKHQQYHPIYGDATKLKRVWRVYGCDSALKWHTGACRRLRIVYSIRVKGNNPNALD